MDKVSAELQKRLQSTSRQLLTHALEHALDGTQTENNVLQTIVNMQAALELLSKLYVLRREGWRSIVDPKFHLHTEPDLISAIETGAIKTIPFWKSRELASETLYLNEDDLQLLDTFQNRRNQLMHLGLVSPPKEILNEAIWFLVRIIHQLDWKDSLPVHQQYLSNSLQLFIGGALYKKLMTNSCYIDESVDRAYELYSDVRYCLECGNEALVENEVEDFTCFVCGFQVNADAIGFIDCPACKSTNGIAYDQLNIEFNERIDGKCCRCRKIISVSRCKECGNDFVSAGKCNFCHGSQETPIN